MRRQSPYCFGLPKSKPKRLASYVKRSVYACMRQADMASVSTKASTPGNPSLRGACCYRGYRRSSGHHCVVLGCSNNQRKRSRLLNVFCPEHNTCQKWCGCGLFSFHRFPRADKNPELRRQWIAAVNRKDFEPSKYVRVCSEHFVDGKPSEENPVPVLRLGYTKKVVKRRLRQCVAERNQPSSDHEQQTESGSVEDNVCVHVITNSSTLLDPGAEQADPAVNQLQQQPRSAHRGNTDLKVQSRQTCPAPSNKGQVLNSALEMCHENDGITSGSQRSPPTDSARGEFRYKPQTRTMPRNQSCAVIGCGNTNSKRERLMAELCPDHNVPRSKCGCGVFTFHRPPSVWKHHENWKVAFSLPDDHLTYSTWVCSLHLGNGKTAASNPALKLHIGRNSEGLKAHLAKLVQNSSKSWTSKRNVSTQKDAPLMFPVMCQAGEQTAALRDSATQWEIPHDQVRVEHSYADMKWLTKYSSLKWLLRRKQDEPE